MSLVDNDNINQDGGTSAAFDINVQVEVKDVVGDDLSIIFYILVIISSL